MSPPDASWFQTFDAEGFALLPAPFSDIQVTAMAEGLAAALADDRGDGAGIGARSGGVYAARNVLSLWPAATEVWRQEPIPAVLQTILGPRYGLVRVLFFDKPPAQTWSLPWHKDLTVAVERNDLPSRLFSKPTRKAGVPHAEAPLEVLQAMVTARIHLDEVTEENGPLKVVPGSHRTGKEMAVGGSARPVLGGRGSVMFMRPLVAHASGSSAPDTRRHRRVLHLEFAAAPELPNSYRWHTFLPGNSRA